MGKMSRNKGAGFERTVAAMLRDAGFPNAARGLGQARSGGEVPDVDGTGYWIECKARKAIDVTGAYEQGIEACAGARPVIAITKRDRGPVLVTMSFDEFVRLAGGIK
jgi:Holliday junction resolvase